MKITKKQLKRIIREEKSRLDEASGADEMALVEEIIDLLIKRGAIGGGQPQRGYDIDIYQEALEYLQAAVIPALDDLALEGY